MGIIIEKFDKIALKFATEKIKENPKYMEECMIHLNDPTRLTSDGDSTGWRP